jgi:cellulose synthase/poly-beta-1,6-N-acetylglucosamine synthase-like glycosyltransferase
VDFNHRFGEYLYVDEVIGVCMLLKRELVDDLLKNNERFGLPEGALLDPMFGVGGADDNDLSMRIYQLGWKSLINRKAFIYHYVSATFKELYKGNASAFMEYGQKSLDKFRSKWKKELEEMEKNIEKMPVLFCCDDIGVKYKDKLGELKKLKEKYPSLKVNAFVVAKDIDETVIEFLKQDWIEVNVHAYEHDGIPELNFEDKADRIKKAVEELDEVLPEKMGYRAPGFRLTASTYPILKMLGFSHIVHQNRVQLLNEQKVISNIPLINTHIYEDLNKNNYEKCNFKFISEVI